MRSLRIKLLTGFVLVALLALGVVGLGANLAISGQFDRYLRRGGEVRALGLAPSLAEHYASQGNWQGVERLLTGPPGWGMIRRAPEQIPRLMRDRLVLADAGGVVVFDSQGEAEGRRLGDRLLASGVPIVVDGQEVGTVLMAPWERAPAGSLERRFLTAVNRWLLAAALLAGGLALILGLYLDRQMVAPLRELGGAAQAIAGGDLTHRVEVTSGDEIGDLGEAFNRMAQALERNEQLRRQMVADIAHELRTPLTVIRANLEALQDGVFPLDRESLLPIYEDTLLLTRLVEDLHQLSLVEAGQLTLECQRVSVADLVQQAVEGHRPRATERRIDLAADIAEELPALWLDPQRMGQVLHNLLANALRHTPSGGRVAVAGWCFEVRHGQSSSPHPLPEALLPLTEGHWLALSVADTGPGIPPQGMAYVFERFYREDRSRSQASGGTGLGLAIVRQLVEAHEGAIAAQNNPQGGARFTLVLPMR